MLSDLPKPVELRIWGTCRALESKPGLPDPQVPILSVLQAPLVSRLV